MATIIDMPKLSDTMTTGDLVKWLKKEGDEVKTGDMLAEVQTDKATMELESFFDGVLLKIFAPDGSQVAVGDPLCAIGKAGEKVDAPATKSAAPAPVKKDTDETESSSTGASTTAQNEVEAQPAADASKKPSREPSAPTRKSDEAASAEPARRG